MLSFLSLDLELTTSSRKGVSGRTRRGYELCLGQFIRSNPVVVEQLTVIHNFLG